MAGDDLLKTPLHDWHQGHKGRLVEFGGWSMPVQYSTIIEEHNAVRQRVGLFDISHMGRLKFEGPGALAWLEKVTTNHVAKLAPGQIQYSLVLTETGGILDDILVYRRPDGLAVVCNASNRLKVVAQFEKYRGGFDARLIDQTFETAMIAVQGPAALATTQRHFDEPLTDVRYYRCVVGTFLGVPALASRTGYTGEDGFELILPKEHAVEAWEALLDAGRVFGILPVGLGARDTLRFEAAMPLHGHEMSEAVGPHEAGLGWAVKPNKGDFVGRDAVKMKGSTPGPTRVGLVLEGKRIAREGSAVKRDGMVIGTVTSGTFSPTLGKSLAMASVPKDVSLSEIPLSIDVRGHEETARIVPLPFYRRATSPVMP
jgi:aminomethyltransferase